MPTLLANANVLEVLDFAEMKKKQATLGGFEKHLKALVKAFGKAGKIEGEVVEPFVNAEQLELQASLFCQWVSQNVSGLPKATMAVLWTRMSESSYFVEHCSEWIKLARIAVVMVAVSVEDKGVFSAMNFVCSDRRSSLSTHLEACVRMKVQEVFNLDNFPYSRALEVYDAIVKRTNIREGAREGKL